MNKYILSINGMACTMCEAHIKDVIYGNVKGAGKVHASFRKGEADFICDEDVDTETLRKSIEQTGYELVSVSTEEVTKRRLFGR